ncbi:ABC-type taurine transport system, periplasmic component [Nocardia otitidiscaviarum]|uniref:Thiamine pyrimidine synthase n=1 Tax=Nocardia otitidiscaviarum TaxID=1823 RepID=A0A378YBN5_9NOCA|nr:ABC transporter substrate-binding protein [Nocardia otitidiscaviarum]SUA73769.1 ABC-type taurine transport system, periplasmic component [Nocardia otitidiscaviarum]
MTRVTRPVPATALPMLNRRSFLRYSALTGAALGGAGLLAACGDDAAGPANGTTPDGSKYGTVAIQLSWIKNIEFAGEYFADSKGYFREAGFGSVNLVAGGAASTSVEAGLGTGKIWLGMSAPQTTAPAVLEGLPAKIVGATYQKNPFCIVSAAGSPIASPQDMKGRRIGVQDTNQLIFAALLTANGMRPDDVTIVPAQFDPTPLTQETIDNEREKLKAFLAAEIKGWRDAVADPAEGARLAVEVYGKDLQLDLTEQTEEAIAQNDLVVSADTAANGLFTMTDDLIERNIAALGKSGIDIEADRLFDMSVLAEVYAEQPDLK